ncbi:membrane-spanning 4-domains subfamily A member 12-like [Carassius carassius]|uniref:membrane-spanning 4-domains subfamily A member 12-like n=1 Tax=Carassius carassius TaxID=217509 RepID=UPI002868C1D0|nr:membrane-spanning 4-domains subfamily A member 12-like [Carassius carassius]
MENSNVITSDNARFIIQQARGTYHNTGLKGFLKAQPKALGTVQIITGVMVFLLGIVLTANLFRFGSIVVFSGITYWGSFIYISTGSLSVAAQNKLHLCVVKASLGMNVISAITAALSIFLIGN